MRNSPAAKSVQNIKCLCFWNGYEFKIGNRYITLARTYTDGGQWKKKNWQLDITEPVAERIKSIAALYRPDDANRVFAIVHQIFNAYHPNFSAE